MSYTPVHQPTSGLPVLDQSALLTGFASAQASAELPLSLLLGRPASVVSAPAHPGVKTVDDVPPWHRHADARARRRGASAPA